MRIDPEDAADKLKQLAQADLSKQVITTNLDVQEKLTVWGWIVKFFQGEAGQAYRERKVNNVAQALLRFVQDYHDVLEREELQGSVTELWGHLVDLKKQLRPKQQESFSQVFASLGEVMNAPKQVWSQKMHRHVVFRPSETYDHTLRAIANAKRDLHSHHTESTIGAVVAGYTDELRELDIMRQLMEVPSDLSEVLEKRCKNAETNQLLLDRFSGHQVELARDLIAGYRKDPDVVAGRRALKEEDLQRQIDLLS